MKNNKTQLRESYLQIRNMLSDEFVQFANQNLTRKVIWFINKYQLKKIGIYLGAQNEVDTKEIIQFCLLNKIEVYVPKSELDSNQMQFKRIKNLTTDLVKNEKWDILEPLANKPDLVDSNDLDVLFMPLVVFDKELNRVGMGKGYYDRWIKEHDFHKYKIGLAQSSQFTNKIIDADVHDVKLNFVISEKQIHIPLQETEELDETLDVTYWRLNEDELD
ncbi:5-formyltetrahydrofolate cyclo-ligase [Williamsoniiplasma luminosum]|uniref:5-formyltetrahydrofolate cyclo-ligase n=1 Tax=Williamsoniiplasma luminosum TaxID=214888 RepID=A0A2S0NL90_9MOLU|nr:5-formyltetrahydrofolate cyclo-ligase [Williamsoniiplasma luminosum]AVP49775.1 MAG: 5-formyltetrahydrofolate cyclo-ligase [Williamsoniiplasma luminosum]